MSATEAPESRTALEELPTYELDCLCDDREDPAEITIFSPGTRDFVTEWVTADESSAVPLDRIR